MSKEDNRIKIIESVSKYINRFNCSKQEAIDFVAEEYPNLKKTTIERYVRQINPMISKSVDKDLNKRHDTTYKKKYFELLRRTSNMQSISEALCAEVTPIKFVKYPKLEFNNTISPASITLMLSDIHFGRQVTEQEIEYFNRYDFDVACARLYRIFLDFMKWVNNNRHIYTLDTLYLDLLGDNINDESRNENKHTNQWPNTITTVNAGKVLSQLVLMLTPNFNKVVITGVIGNESRIPEEMPGKIQYHNYDFILYNMMKSAVSEYIKNGRIDFEVPLSPEWVVEKGSKKVLLTHGHNISGSNTGGFPVQRLANYIKQQQEMRRDTGGFDIIEVGHFHTEYSIEDEKLLVNPSVCGVDAWTKSAIKKKGKVGQTAYILSDDYGIEAKRIIKNFDIGDDEHPFEYDYKF